MLSTKTKLSESTVPVPAPLYPDGHPSGLPAAAKNMRHPRMVPAGRFWNVMLMTCLPAVDGGILLLAASGRLADAGAAVVLGLTMIAGAGAWIAAREAFSGGARGWQAWGLLLVLGIATVLSTVAAAWIGITIGQAVSLHVLPKAAGVVLFLVGAEVAGLRLPRPVGLPLPAVAVLAGIILEVSAQWTLS